ncbi:hypothetical protein DICVIV_05050 [Dictyocaulus viviparus]|uniref:COMM domain-containing protein n=1 Tax=Dictyocaulus viviparus TaxID=29172 RepID=A0A0D8XYA2_DICVI|nr:hypothetical protein DICVIV_05050 [Dictyocaulus viviparus]
MNCYRNNTTLPITKADLPAEVKVALLEFVKNQLCETSSAGKIFDWNVCVVVGNNYVKKSLEVKVALLEFVKNQLCETSSAGKIFDWNVCVVVGNNYVKKSLEVITELNFDGEQLEFDTDMFGKLRHQLASAIVAMESYSSGL